MTTDSRKFAHYDPATGQVLGFYTPEVHGDNMPTPNRVVSQAEWEELCQFGSERIFDTNAGRVIQTPWPLDEMKRRRSAGVMTHHRSVLALGPSLSVPGKGDVDSDAKSQEAILAAATVGNRDWIMADNTVQPLTGRELLALADTILSFRADCATTARQHKDAIALLTTQEEVEEYVIDTGWPSGAGRAEPVGPSRPAA